MRDLPDVNVWVALTVREHPDHARAVEYWTRESAETIAFCRTTALGLVRVSAGRNTVGGTPLRLEIAWNRYRRWREDEAVVLLEEPFDVESPLDGWIDEGIVTRKLWTDAYLAAFALAAGLRLVTLDKDFERFPGLDLLLL